MHKMYLKNLERHFGHMNVILLRSDHRHISDTYVAIFTVVKSKNTNIFLMWRDHSTVKYRIVLVKTPVKWQNIDDYKIFLS
jgi:hypothetical protein